MSSRLCSAMCRWVRVDGDGLEGDELDYGYWMIHNGLQMAYRCTQQVYDSFGGSTALAVIGVWVPC
jgi:hypothetical protein